MTRIDEVERRLIAWARWKAMRLTTADSAPQTAQPPLDPWFSCEAAETEGVIERLPGNLRSSVVQHYLRRVVGGDAADGHLLGAATLMRRIGQVHRVLQGHFDEQRAHADREGERAVMLGRLTSVGAP